MYTKGEKDKRGLKIYFRVPLHFDSSYHEDAFRKQAVSGPETRIPVRFGYIFYLTMCIVYNLEYAI